MAKWTKPSGLEIETNDAPATIAQCEKLGWERDHVVDAAIDEKDADYESVTREYIVALTGPELNQLIDENKLDVRKNGNVEERRAAILALLFPAEPAQE